MADSRGAAQTSEGLDPECAQARPQNAGQESEGKKKTPPTVPKKKARIGDQEQQRWWAWKQRVISEHGGFLRRYRWHLWLSIDAPGDMGLERAALVVRRYLEMLGGNLYAYWAFERGEIAAQGHIHMLLGGKFNKGTVHQVDGQWVWRYKERDFRIVNWNFPVGRTLMHVNHVELYDPREVKATAGGATTYISDHVPRESDAGGFIGTPKRPRRRKRGR